MIINKGMKKYTLTIPVTEVVITRSNTIQDLPIS